ncbi:MAG: ATP-binding cassette domain-containing protein, partial [Calditrichaeota bacterium]
MHITVRGLSKEYKNGCTALRDVNLDIQSGLFGLLGPNGAGKTTLMKILVTLLKPTGGEVKFNGFDLIKNRRQIRELLGYLPQDFTVFSRLMTWEFLDYSASLAGIFSKSARQKAVDEMLAQVGLFDAR